MKRILLLFFRSVKNNPKLFLINLLGFSMGVTSVLFIYLYSFKEIRTDRFHQKHANLYRVIEKQDGSSLKESATFFPLGALMENHFSEISGYSRYMERPYEINVGSHNFGSMNLSFIDSSFFSLFDFHLNVGDYHHLFEIPNGAIITRKIADRFFSDEDPLGKEIEVNEAGEEIKRRLLVVGVLKNYPEESTLNPQIIVNIEPEEKKAAGAEWNICAPQLFLFMPECLDTKKIASQISGIIANESSWWDADDENRFELQRFNDIYLHSLDVSDELKKGNIYLVRILLIIGIILMLITSLNYVILNLGVSQEQELQKYSSDTWRQ